jgi:molybdopterin synthase sulfur carrier subunit
MNILFFAGIKDQLGIDQLDWPIDGETTVGILLESLQQQDVQWQQVLGDKKVLVAVNQTMARLNTKISNDDEVAFFPPVTGG